MANLIKLAENMPMPISVSMHKVLISCGYSLVEQAPFQLIYEIKYSKKLIFTSGSCVYSKWRDCSPADGFPAWNIFASLKFGFDIDPIKYLDILNGIDAINYFSLPQFQQIVSSTLNNDSNGIGGFGNNTDHVLCNVAYDKRQTRMISK
jgi:hypothetical protein